MHRTRFPGLSDGWARLDGPAGTQMVDVAKRAERMSQYEHQILRQDIAELLPAADRAKFQAADSK